MHLLFSKVLSCQHVQARTVIKASVPGRRRIRLTGVSTQVARDALPPYISKDTAESILFIGKAMRVLKQSAGSKRPAGAGTFHLPLQLPLIHVHTHPAPVLRQPRWAVLSVPSCRVMPAGSWRCNMSCMVDDATRLTTLSCVLYQHTLCM